MPGVVKLCLTKSFQRISLLNGSSGISFGKYAPYSQFTGSCWLTVAGAFSCGAELFSCALQGETSSESNTAPRTHTIQRTRTLEFQVMTKPIINITAAPDLLLLRLPRVGL